MVPLCLTGGVVVKQLESRVLLIGITSLCYGLCLCKMRIGSRFSSGNLLSIFGGKLYSEVFPEEENSIVDSP